MPIITIYQGASGEGQELAESLAQALGYRCVGRELLVEASRRYGVPEAKLNDIVEKGPHWWERLLQDLRPYRIALQATLCELAHDGIGWAIEHRRHNTRRHQSPTRRFGRTREPH